MAKKIASLPGFRNFYPETCAERNYLFAKWREVASRYGFVEYEGPLLEPTELYTRKSGEEVVGQLFAFEDKGERAVAMRPELTPTLARMAGARQRDYRKPLRWFSIGSFFRYEKPQKGRTREFYQFNCDILGEASPAADAELVALAIDLMRNLGFTREDFVLRLSDRTVWDRFLEDASLNEAKAAEFLAIVDKWEREKPETVAAGLEKLGTSREAVEKFMKSPATTSANLEAVMANLGARGLADFVEVNLSVVRGLAYYTGAVFEVFDIGRSMRAVAGGGRYDHLLELVSGTAMPATGFAMGDVVITDLVKETPEPCRRLAEAVAADGALEIYVVVADEAQRAQALAGVQKLRTAGYRVDYPLEAAKVPRQFKTAEQMNARAAVLYGSEYPSLVLKDLATRSETTINESQLPAAISQLLASTESGPLIA